MTRDTRSYGLYKYIYIYIYIHICKHNVAIIVDDDNVSLNFILRSLS